MMVSLRIPKGWDAKIGTNIISKWILTAWTTLVCERRENKNSKPSRSNKKILKNRLEYSIYIKKMPKLGKQLDLFP